MFRVIVPINTLLEETFLHFHSAARMRNVELVAA